MTKRKHTPWFNATEYRPVRVGWYEFNLYAGEPCFVRRWWDGRNWRFAPQAHFFYLWVGYAWRGLAEPPT